MTQPDAPPEGWTLPAWIEHSRLLREADQRLAEERDRRQAEARAADQRALEIKETADSRALLLAAENQRLRDLSHNDLLNQWRDDRTLTATKAELASVIERFDAKVQPLVDFVSSQHGTQGQSARESARNLAWLIVAAGLLAGLAAAISPHIH